MDNWLSNLCNSWVIHNFDKNKLRKFLCIIVQRTGENPRREVRGGGDKERFR